MFMKDLKKILNEFYHGRIDISRSNYGNFPLLPKCEGDDKIQFDNIGLLDVMCLNLLNKWLINRNIAHVTKVVAPIHTTFI